MHEARGVGFFARLRTLVHRTFYAPSFLRLLLPLVAHTSTRPRLDDAKAIGKTSGTFMIDLAEASPSSGLLIIFTGGRISFYRKALLIMSHVSVK